MGGLTQAGGAIPSFYLLFARLCFPRVFWASSWGIPTVLLPWCNRKLASVLNSDGPVIGFGSLPLVAQPLPWPPSPAACAARSARKAAQWVLDLTRPCMWHTRRLLGGLLCADQRAVGHLPVQEPNIRGECSTCNVFVCERVRARVVVCVRACLCTRARACVHACACMGTEGPSGSRALHSCSHCPPPSRAVLAVWLCVCTRVRACD